MPEPPDRWIPERTGSAVIVCVRGSRCGNPSQIIDWGSAEDAELADRLLYGEPCDKGCVGNHIRVWTEPGRLRVAGGSCHDPPPPSLADELAECYPRLVNGRPIQPGAPTLSATPACWGALSILNMPLSLCGEHDEESAQDAAASKHASRS